MRRTISIFLIFSIVFVLAGCDREALYNKEWMIGKTSKQIQARYGKFDYVTEDKDEYGLYKNCRCGYGLKVGAREKYTGDPEPDEYLFVYFDENGVAYKVKKWINPGG